MEHKKEVVTITTVHNEIQELKTILSQPKPSYNKTPKTEPLLSEEMPLMSLDQKDLFTALSKAQADMPIAIKTSINPYFKSNYASFSDIVKASRSVLCKNGLAVSQTIVERENGQRYLYTVLAHSSGQFKASRVKISPTKSDIQEFGKYISYLKRYAYASLVGVADAMEDDDGESVMKEVREERSSSYNGKKVYKPTPLPSEETITREQLEQLDEILEDHDDVVDMVLDGLKIQALADMPKQQFGFVLKRIQKIIATKKTKSKK